MIHVEYRDDLRVLLLDGLPPDERQLTLKTIESFTAKKLNKLRSQDPAELVSNGQATTTSANR